MKNKNSLSLVLVLLGVSSIYGAEGYDEPKKSDASAAAKITTTDMVTSMVDLFGSPYEIKAMYPYISLTPEQRSRTRYIPCCGVGVVEEGQHALFASIFGSYVLTVAHRDHNRSVVASLNSVQDPELVVEKVKAVFGQEVDPSGFSGSIYTNNIENDSEAIRAFVKINTKAGQVARLKIIKDALSKFCAERSQVRASIAHIKRPPFPFNDVDGTIVSDNKGQLFVTSFLHEGILCNRLQAEDHGVALRFASKKMEVVGNSLRLMQFIYNRRGLNIRLLDTIPTLVDMGDEEFGLDSISEKFASVARSA